MTRSALFDKIGMVHANASHGILQDHFGGSAVPTTAPISLKPGESKHLFCMMMCAVHQFSPSFVRKQGATVSTYYPAGYSATSMPVVQPGVPFYFEVVLTANDTFFDVYPNVADTVDLTIEEDAIY